MQWDQKQMLRNYSEAISERYRIKYLWVREGAIKFMGCNETGRKRYFE